MATMSRVWHINPEKPEHFIPPASHSALRMPRAFISQAPPCEHREQTADPCQCGVLPAKPSV